MDHVNPILTRVADGGQASWTNSEQPGAKSQRSIPPHIKKMVLELGLRFRPLGGENQEEYAAAVTLLGQDVAHVAPGPLETAIAEWVRTKRFLPRAAELLDMVAQMQGRSRTGTDAGFAQLQDHCDRLNALNNGRDDWRVVGKAPNRTIAKQNERRDTA